MKQFLFITMALVLLGTENCFAQIVSTTQGGNWADTLTWIGHRIPGETDNVIINGPVVVAAHPFADPRKCLNLQVSPSGKLYHPDTDWNLEVLGTVVNNGIIQKAGLIISGNIINAGYWNTSAVILKSQTPHTIELLNNSKIIPGQLSALSGSNDSITALSDLRIDSSLVNFVKVNLPEGRDMLIYGNFTGIQTPTAGTGMKIYGSQGSVVRFMQGAWVTAAKFSGLVLAGKAVLNGICELENVTIQDTLTDAGFQANLDLSLKGTVQNTGKIFRSSGTWGFYIMPEDTFRTTNRVTGVALRLVKNNGLIECRGEGGLIRSDISTALQQPVFNFKDVILDSCSLSLGGGKIIMTPASVLRFFGTWVTNVYFEGNDGVIVSTPLSIVYQSSFTGCTFANLTLAGITQFSLTNNRLINVTNDGVIRSNGFQNNGGFYVEQNFRNLGTITKYGSFYTIMNLAGNVENFGMISPDFIYPQQARRCEIFSADTALISGLSMDFHFDSSEVVFVSPAIMNNVHFNATMTNPVIKLEGNGELILNGNSGGAGIKFLGTNGQDVKFNSTPQNEISFINSAFENICIKGKLFTAMSMFKNVVNKDSLVNTASAGNQLYFESDFLNEGYIWARSGYLLNIVVNGNLRNAKEIVVSQIDLNGSSPHLIQLIQGKSVKSRTRFIDNNSYSGMWYLNNTTTSFTAPVLVFDSVTVQKMGQYRHSAYTPTDTTWTEIFRIDTSLTPTAYHEAEEGSCTPAAFSLEQNYPNPFNPATRIRFSITERAFVEIDIFNAAGEAVCHYEEGELMPGRYSRLIDAGKFTSGVYFLRISAGNYSGIIKMILIK